MAGLVERNDQLLELDRVFADCNVQGGQVVLLEGPLGSGKTELLRVFAERRRRSGVRHLSATCSAAERALPFGVVNQLFGSTNWLDGTGPEPGTPEAVRTYRELSLSLFDQAEQEPVLITVDDIRHADEQSLHFLLHLVRWLRPAQSMLVLTDESSPRPARLRFLAELSRLPDIHRLVLKPLSRSGVTDLITERLGAEAVWLFGEKMYAAGGGNPLLLNALIDDHRRTGDGPQPIGYGLALLSCLYRAEPVLSETMRALAVLGDDASATELGRLLSCRDAATANQALAALNAAELLEDGRFRHPVARAAVLDDLDPAGRAELHRRAAELLHDRGATAPQVAHHLIVADHTQVSWATDVLSEAAEHAMVDGEIELAAECLRLAHRSCADESACAAIRARLAWAEWQVDPASVTRHFAPLAAAARAGRLRLPDCKVLIKQLLWHGRGEEVGALLSLLRTRGELQDLEAWLAYTHPSLASDRRTLGRHENRIVPEADPQLRSVAVLADALSRNRSHEAADRAEQVLRDLPLHCRSPWTEDAALLALQVLILVDRLDATVAWCASETATAPMMRAFFSAARGEVALCRGEPAAAAQHARAALTYLSPKSWGVTVGLPLGTLILATTRLGEFAEATKLLAQSVPEMMFQCVHGLYYLYARGHYYLATDHGHAALADFLTCGELLRGWGLDATGLLPWRTDAAEAWLRLGNPNQVRRLAHEQLGRPGLGTSRSRGPALRVLAAVSPPSRRLPLLTEAIDLAESANDRFEQAKVLAELSKAHAVSNKPRARLLLRQALHLANIYSMGQLTPELLSVSADLGGTESTADPLQGIASLTDSERRVASLAVLGHTNRAIADKLYITASTVEQHLTRVYRKLDIRHRGELPASLWTGLGKTG